MDICHLSHQIWGPQIPCIGLWRTFKTASKNSEPLVPPTPWSCSVLHYARGTITHNTLMTCVWQCTALLYAMGTITHNNTLTAHVWHWPILHYVTGTITHNTLMTHVWQCTAFLCAIGTATPKHHICDTGMTMYCMYFFMPWMLTQNKTLGVHVWHYDFCFLTHVWQWISCIHFPPVFQRKQRVFNCLWHSLRMKLKFVNICRMES